MRGFLHAIRAFAAAMFGVRKRSGAEKDGREFRLAHVAAAGVFMVALFVSLLFLIAHLISSNIP